MNEHFRNSLPLPPPSASAPAARSWDDPFRAPKPEPAKTGPTIAARNISGADLLATDWAQGMPGTLDIARPSIPNAAATTRAARPKGPAARAIGVDFGTSYTSASIAIGDQVYAIADEEGRALHPSIVNYPARGVPIVGWDARQAVVNDPVRTVCSAKRLLGGTFSDPLIAAYLSSLPQRTKKGPHDAILIEIDGNPISPVQVAALLIEHVRRIAERQVGTQITEAVLSVPVAFSENQRLAVRRAAERAGLEPIGMIEEPFAAATSYGFGQDRHELVAIYDFGGGTFDFSVLELKGNDYRILASGGDMWLGGDDFDVAIAQAIANSFWRTSKVDLRQRVVEWQKLIFACEQAKRALTAEPMAEVSVENAVEGVDLREQIDRARFEELGREIVERSITICEETLEQARLKPSSIQQVVLTGGMSRVPLIRQRVSQFFGREIATLVNPEEAVCLGAGLIAAALVKHPARGAARR